tara:strand:+ start:11103 stop:12014 length:912 start_codon:yes stop_codon:yes gene_type:complete
MYITLIAFIVIRYKTKAVLDPNSKISENMAVIIIGVLYGIFTLVNMYLLRSNPVLPVILFISTAIIIYSIVKNIESSPMLENLVVGAQNDNSSNDNSPQVDMDLANLRINLQEFYNNKILTKTLMTLIMYTILIYGLWFSVWKNKCTINDLLCNKDYIFAILYLAFALFVLLDMFRNTKDFGFFEYKDSEKNDVIFNNNWIIYSILYSLYLIYILIISQSIRNTLFGLSMDVNFNLAGLVTIILSIIHFIHYFRLQKARKECNCDTARISVLNNNIKVFQLNSIILPILLIFISLVSRKIPIS